MNKATQQQIMAIFGLSPEDYFWLQIEVGTTYLDNYCPMHREMRAAAKDCYAFWEWWRQIWEERDRRLIHAMSKVTDLGFTVRLDIDEYRKYHAPDNVSLVPNTVVKAEIKKMIRKEVAV